MTKNIKRIIVPIILGVMILAMFTLFTVSERFSNNENADLVIFGDNIDTEYKPFIQDNGVYIAVDTIYKVIDENIFYDKSATKIIITTPTEVIKFKIDEKAMSKNMENIPTETCAKRENDVPYVDINLLKDVYDIKIEYNEKTNTISIDKKDLEDIPIKNDRVLVYADISTDSEVLEILNRNNTVTLYQDSLNHNRWFKVKTDSGIVGYIAKSNIDEMYLSNENEEPTEEEPAEENAKKYIMFWQYGSNLTTLGEEKIEGVNVVSPTWYELKDSSGNISSEFSQSYYDQAKEYGYEIWPIITNGIDSTSYTPETTSEMLSSEKSRENFIKNLLNIAKENKLDGINIDFESMKDNDTDRDLFTQLIREMAPIFRNNGIKLSVDMYFVRYIDRTRVGEAADYVVLMGYDQRGAWSTESGSIAEISWVEENIESLINDSKIPSSKIILGIPFYTRLWTEKEGEKSPTTKVYTMKDCQEFLLNNGLSTVLDETSGQNYAEYTQGSYTYKLWLEDQDSIKKRVETVKKYDLAGVTAWRKGFETKETWQTIYDTLNQE